MAADGMQIVELSPGRREEMFDLLRACLGERETVRRNEDFWRWKHEASPFGHSTVLLGEERSQLIGLRAFLPWQWRSGDNSYRSVRAVDTVTHPDHQRKGVFSRLTLAGLDVLQRKETAFVYNTPNGNSMPGYLKMGWRHVARLPMQVRVLRPMHFVAGVLRHKLVPGGKAGRTRRAGTGLLDSVTSMEDFLNRSDGIEELITRDGRLRGPGLTTARSTPFLHWRYAQHPYVRYYVETVQDGGQLRGALIWRLNDRFGLREAMVCDLLLADDDLDCTRALLTSLRNKVDAHYMIAHFGFASTHRELLGRSGFVGLPGQGMEFVARSLGRDLQLDIFAPADWSLCLGDLEIF